MGDVCDVPEDVAQLLGNALLKEFVRRTVSQELLIFTEKAAGFASES